MDLLSAGRRIAKRRDVKISEKGQGHRARDRRGRHDEVVGVRTRVLQRGPLAHAELVLFVDDDQPQAAKVHVVLEDCVGADHQIDLAGGNRQKDGIAVATGKPTRHQGAADLAVGQQPIEGDRVLPRKNLGGRHERRLAAVRGCKQHGIDRDDRLSAPHVAVQKAVHGHVAGHVGGDFADRAVLRRSEREGKEAADAGVDLGGRFQCHGAALALKGGALQRQGELQDQQFLVDEAAARLGQGLVIGGKVDLAQRAAQRPQSVRFPIRQRKHLVEQIGVFGQRGGYDPPQLPLGQALGERIEGQDRALRFLFPFGQEDHAGVRHFPHQPFALRFAGHHDALTQRKPLALVGLVEPEDAQMAGAASHEHPDHAAAGPGASQLDVLDDARDRLKLVLLQVGDLAAIGQVLIIARKKEKHVAGVVQAKTMKQIDAARTDARNELHRREQSIGGGLFGCIAHRRALYRERGSGPIAGQPFGSRRGHRVPAGGMGSSFLHRERGDGAP